MNRKLNRCKRYLLLYDLLRKKTDECSLMATAEIF